MIQYLIGCSLKSRENRRGGGALSGGRLGALIIMEGAIGRVGVSNVRGFVQETHWIRVAIER